MEAIKNKRIKDTEIIEYNGPVLDTRSLLPSPLPVMCIYNKRSRSPSPIADAAGKRKKLKTDVKPVPRKALNLFCLLPRNNYYSANNINARDDI